MYNSFVETHQKKKKKRYCSNEIRKKLKLETLDALTSMSSCGINWRIWIAGQCLKCDTT